MFLSGEMLTMLNVFWTYTPLLSTPIAWKGPDINITSESNLFYQKCVSFGGNVEYVEYVQKIISLNVCFSLRKCWVCWLCSKAFLNKTFLPRKCWIKWICWMFFGFTDLRGTQIQHYSWKKHFFTKHVPFCGNVEYVAYVQSLCPENVSFCWICFYNLQTPFDLRGAQHSTLQLKNVFF